jgi:hypothetical protein
MEEAVLYRSEEELDYSNVMHDSTMNMLQFKQNDTPGNLSTLAQNGTPEAPSSNNFAFTAKPSYQHMATTSNTISYDNIPADILNEPQLLMDQLDDLLLQQLAQEDLSNPGLFPPSFCPDTVVVNDNNMIMNLIVEQPLNSYKLNEKNRGDINTQVIQNNQSNMMTTDFLQQQKNGIYDSIYLENMPTEQLVNSLLQFEKQQRQPSMLLLEEHRHNNHLSEEEATSYTHSEEEEPLSLNKMTTTRICLWTDCGEEFNDLQKLIDHLSDVHMGRGKPTYRCEWDNCPRKDNPFTKRHKMFAHLRVHTGERPFVCPEPGKSTHNKEDIYIYDINKDIYIGCKKQFTRPDSLSTHIKTHSKVRPFICKREGCGKAYYHARSLKKHERTHTQSMNHGQIAYLPLQVMQSQPQLPQIFFERANQVFTPFRQNQNINTQSNGMAFPSSSNSSL